VHTALAQDLLAQALQLAPTPAAAAAVAGDPPAAPQQQQQQQLRLTSFSSNYAGMPALKALPAHSLTRLQFDLRGLVIEEYPKVSDLLAGLSNLQELQLDDACSREVPGTSRWLAEASEGTAAAAALKRAYCC
jgi:hypothetical protein